MTLDASGNNWITAGDLTRVALMGQDGTDVVMGAYSNHNLVLRTNNTARLTIASTGAATFSSSVTATGGFEIPNGQFYRARRSSGSLLTDMIGIPSGTDDVRILTTGDFNVINGSLSNILTVKNGGNVGIGTTSPATTLDVRGSTSSTIRVGSSTHGGSGDEFANLEFFWGDPDYAEVKAKIYAKNTGNVGPGGGGAADLLFATTTPFGSLSERMRITSGGDVLVNATATTQGAKFYVNGIGAFGSVYVGALGTGTVYSNAGFLTNTNPSDRRLKTNIIPLTYGLSDILKLNPVSYNWKDGTNGKQFGFIAQEVQEVMPDAVKQGEYLGLEKDAIYSALVNSVKELNKEIELLKSQLNK